MSFEKIEALSQDTIHPRNCILFYNFTPKELQLLKNIGRLTGISDQIVLNAKNSSSIITDILDNQIITSPEPGSSHKAILFNLCEASRINSFLESLKKCRISRPLTAMITPTSLQWSVDYLISNLLEERASLNTNSLPTHHE